MVNVWDFLMRRKPLFLLTVAVFAVSGIIMGTIIDRLCGNIEVPLTGDDPVAVPAASQEPLVRVHVPIIKPTVDIRRVNR